MVSSILKKMKRSAPVRYAQLSDDEFRNGRHIFIFGVWGRCSSTALQRILNSSGEVCIWGEPGDHLVDDLVGLLARMEKKNDAAGSAERKRILSDSFTSGDHSVNYCMAFPKLDSSMDALFTALKGLFQPVVDVNRVGFKEITVRDGATLDILKTLCPRAAFVFLFRNPAEQWPSVKKMAWEKTRTVNQFIDEYRRLAEIYLERDGLFIESSSLYDSEKVDNLIRGLDIAGYDASLLGDGVYAMTGKEPLDAGEAEQLKESGILELYAAMQERAV